MLQRRDVSFYHSNYILDESNPLHGNLISLQFVNKMKRFANFHFIDLERFIETDVTEREMTQKNPTARELLRKNLDTWYAYYSEKI